MTAHIERQPFFRSVRTFPLILKVILGVFFLMAIFPGLIFLCALYYPWSKLPETIELSNDGSKLNIKKGSKEYECQIAKSYLYPLTSITLFGNEQAVRYILLIPRKGSDAITFGRWGPRFRTRRKVELASVFYGGIEEIEQFYMALLEAGIGQVYSDGKPKLFLGQFGSEN